MSERASLEAAIEALEAQRALLGGAVVDAALAPMREHLARLVSPVPGAPPEQVLRQVAVLFLDVVGSTALSQHLDPEEVHEVLDDALERCTAVVVAHDGKVLQYAGDNLLAAFGAEHAQEDDTERAVRCGLELLGEGRALRERVLRAHGQGDCDVRVGIHTGPVLLGGGVDEQSTIRGLTVNIAARMEQTAPSGALRISHDAFLLVRGVFDVRAQPPLVVKGKDEPLATYLVQRAKQRAFRVPARGVEGVLPPMIGRDAELARLIAVVDEVLGQRAPRAVTLVGEPGLGKSRLLHELQGALEVHAHRFWLLQGRAHPSSRLQPYGMLRDLLAWRLQIADGERAEAARSKLVEGLVPWLGERAEAKADIVGQLLGLDFSESPHVRGLEPRLIRTLGFAALHDYLRGLAASGNAVALLLEDLHWADDGSLDFIAGLGDALAEVPMLVVASARPELFERRPAWAEGGTGRERMALDTGDGTRLAQALLGRVVEGADALRAMLVERCDGNPFFMEELVRMFLDDGVIAVEAGGWRVLPERLRLARVPATLVGVLQARLDALPAGDRLALQQASIVGHVFWDQALAAIDPDAPSAVPSLRRRALIHRRERSAFEGTTEESFHHHLLQQVTYDTVLKPARRAGHAAAAGWLAERLADRSAEYLAITADHYERAGEPAKALEYLTRAVRDAQLRFASQAALEYAERALNNPAATDPRRRAALYLAQQTVADLLGLRALQESALAARGDIAEALDDDPMRAEVTISRALLASRRGDENAAFELAQRGAELAAKADNAYSRALALGQMAWSDYSLGRTAEALKRAEQAVEKAVEAVRRDDAFENRVMEVQTLTLRAIIEKGMNLLARSRATLTGALAIARERSMRRAENAILETLGTLELHCGRHALAGEYFQASVARAEELGSVIYMSSGRISIAQCHVDLGNHSAALDQITLADALALRCESQEHEGRAIVLRARIEAAAGDAVAAEARLGRAAALFETIDSAPFACEVRAELALLHLGTGRLAEAKTVAERIAAELDAGLSTGSIDEPLKPRWACHRVWRAAGDARAGAAIEEAYAALRTEAAHLHEGEMRRGFLEDVPLHRAIVADWQESRSP